MAQKTNALWIIISVIIILVAAGIYYFAVGSHGSKQGTSDSAAMPDAAAQKFQELPRDSDGNVIVEIKDFIFNPAEVTIYPGQGVKWINKDTAVHQVYGLVGASGEIRSQKLNEGSYYVYTFDKSGTYEYHCTFHPDMKGTIIVK